MVLAVLSACGGSASGPDRAPLDYTAVSSESPASSQTVDIKSLDLLPLPLNGRWEYEIVDEGGKVLGKGARTAAAPKARSNATVVITETEGDTSHTEEVIAGDTGIMIDHAADESLPPKARTIIGSIREYAFPTYAPGEMRNVVRQGEWDQDRDGDGLNEVFRLEYSQIFLGFENVKPAKDVVNAVRFSNAYRLEITESKSRVTAGFVMKEDAYLAPGVGAVRYVRRYEDLEGKSTRSAEIWNLTGTQNVEADAEADTTATIQKLAVKHNNLVYDPNRIRYYASVPSLAPEGGNMIATIEAGTGFVSYSAPVGSEPNAMALSASGKYLYVGLDGAGEVVKLNLPSMTVAAHIPLTGDASYGMLIAESIAASPKDADTFAVSLRARSWPSHHKGIVLFQGAPSSSKRTQGPVGSNLIVFDQAGTGFFGFNNESSEFGLRKIAVQADALVEGVVRPEAGGFYNVDLFLLNGDVLLDNKVYNGSSLVQKGGFALAAGCVPLATQMKAVCRRTDVYQPMLQVYDTTSFAAKSVIRIPSLTNVFGSRMLAGPSGQIALATHYGESPASELYLVKSPILK